MSLNIAQVICGDGIHNLADGLAIGAAFADGYMSGLSTSLAILCHELPHEIGDFAMLLKAGMTVRQAVFYNVLSSVLALLGMVAGLLLGTIHNFSSWMFAATAGAVSCYTNLRFFVHSNSSYPLEIQNYRSLFLE